MNEISKNSVKTLRIIDCLISDTIFPVSTTHLVEHSNKKVANDALFADFNSF